MLVHKAELVAEDPAPSWVSLCQVDAEEIGPVLVVFEQCVQSATKNYGLDPNKYEEFIIVRYMYKDL